MTRVSALVLVSSIIAFAIADSAARNDSDLSAMKTKLAEMRGVIPSAAAAVEPPPKCGTSIALIADDMARLTRDDDLNSLLQRPDSLSLTLGSQHFQIHYIDGTSDIPYHFDEDISPADGVPDYINRVSEIFENAWRVEVDSLGYAPPLPDAGRGGDNRYDVYVRNLGSGYFGFTYRDSVVDGYRGFSYVEIENDFAESPSYRDRPLDGVRVTAAHEFFHAIQFAYDAFEYESPQFGEPKPWWMEASATWMEDILYDSINDYRGYLPYFYKYPWMSLTTFASVGDIARIYHPYGSCVWPIFLTERFEDSSIIREIWERCGDIGGYNALPATNSALFARGSGLENAFLEFAVWNFHVGDFADTLRYFSEGHLYPEVDTTGFVDDLNALPYYPLSEGAEALEELAANYHVISPAAAQGGVDLSFDGMDLENNSWKVAILGYRPATGLWLQVPLNPDNWQGTAQWPNWDSYSAIVIIPVISGVLASDTTDNIYSGQAAFNPSLILNNDVMAVQFLSPPGAGRRGDAVTPVVRYSNLGRNPADFSARLVIQRQDTIYNETVNVTALSPNEFHDVAFPQFTPQDIGRYLLRARVEFSQDEFATNDTLTMSFSALGQVGALLSAYPSPFVLEGPNDILTIPFSFDPGFSSRGSKLQIYDVSGGLVSEIAGDRYSAAGSATFFGFRWDGRNGDGDYVASGIYIYQAFAGGQTHAGKIALINKLR